ncbi:MAG: hypothetical protein JWM33_1785, partial [Caulobacteraceae bacterium]|nr:hypothetical protein [Caulobacteraceae bacterium]
AAVTVAPRPMPSAPGAESPAVAPAPARSAPSATAAAPAPVAPPEKIAPTTFTVACLSNSCSQSAALAAAIKAGDVDAAMAAGGSASDVLSALIAAETLAGHKIGTLDPAEFARQIKPESVQFWNFAGSKPGVRYETQAGKVAVITQARVVQTPGGTPQPTAVVYGMPPGTPSNAGN